MEEKPNYYAIIPANVRYDNDLRANAKLMYGEITALSSKYGECCASNNYFAKLYEVDSSAISKWITQLKDKQYINVEYQTNGKEIKKRIIKISGIDKCQYLLPKDNGGYCQKAKDNNTRNNNTSIKEIYKENIPTLDEVKDYCLNVRHNDVDYEKFFDYYNEGKWKDKEGKPVKNWKQRVITWEGRNKKKDVPNWFDKEQVQQELTEQEQKEMDDLLQF